MRVRFQSTVEELCNQERAVCEPFRGATPMPTGRSLAAFFLIGLILLWLNTELLLRVIATVIVATTLFYFWKLKHDRQLLSVEVIKQPEN